MKLQICALGCQPTNNLYKFPNRTNDKDRRKLWLSFFDMEEPNMECVFACDRHFSHLQMNHSGIRSDAVPDVPIIYGTSSLPFRRKPKNWRNNVIVVTPRDPEFAIYRHETGIFPQNLFDVPNTVQHTTQTPIIKSVSCSMTTQTNTRLCGSVEISDIREEYRLNCFYCCEMFLLEKWSKFVEHMKEKHFEREEAFKRSQYLSEDHDYTPIRSPSKAPLKPEIKINMVPNPKIQIPQPLQSVFTEPILSSSSKVLLNPEIEINLVSNPIIQVPPPSQPVFVNPISSPSKVVLKPKIKINTFSKPILHVSQPPQEVFKEPVVLPPLLPKPHKYSNNKTIKKCVKNVLPTPPPLLAKPEQSENKPFNISLADKLIKLLNETVLNPNFLHTEEDNIVIIKNAGSNNIETSSFLTNLMSGGSITSSKPVVNKLPSTVSTSKHTRPIYTLNCGQQNIPSRRPSVSRTFLPILPKNKRRLARQALKNIKVFENVYKTVKRRPPKVVDSEDTCKDSIINEGSERETSTQSLLSRCLKRTNTPKIETGHLNNPFSIESFKQKPIELVFEFTPEDIIVSLLESMKSYPALWEFHDQPFNRDYNKAIQEICKKINDKWSLNVTLLKMRRSINRILRFYRFMLPRESIDTFSDYFDKCAMFLPSSAEEIPRARCVYCCVCYKRDVDLRKHLKERHKCLKWPYKCQKCLERFRYRDEFELHKHLPHYVEIFKCEQCDKRFDRRNLYNKHVASHKKTIQRRLEAVAQNQEPVLYTELCKICGRYFKSKEDLSRHEFNHEYKPFKCEICSNEYCAKSYLNLHMKKHRKELDFVCEVCGKGFIRRAYLNEHMTKHTGAKITCNICNLKLRKCSLSRHLRLVHVATEGTIEGTFRAKNYRYKKFLYQNTTHLGTKPVERAREKLPRQYKCKICKIHFNTLKQLKDHNKQFHSDVQKKLPCKICQFEFKHTHNLRRHYRYKHNLHVFQVFKLLELNEDLDSVLSLKSEEMEAETEAECISYVQNKQHDNVKISHSDKIQDEIMKAVESIDKQEIRIDDDHSMNEFFTDLLKQ